MSQAPETSHDDHDSHAHQPIPGEPWSNAALAVFIAAFFAAGVYSAANAPVHEPAGEATAADGVGGHEATAGHAKEGHAAEPAARHEGEGANEPSAAPEAHGDQGAAPPTPEVAHEAPHEGAHEGK